MKILTEEIAQSLKIDSAIAFRHFKRPGRVPKSHTLVLYFWQNRTNRIVFRLRFHCSYATKIEIILTCDGKWIVYDNLPSKRSWKQARECAEPVVKTVLQPMKAVLPIWWDCRNFELLVAGKTIMAMECCKQMTNLNVSSHEKNQKTLLLQYDNGKPHLAK